MYADEPYSETCPCCDSDMAFEHVGFADIHVHCFRCGHDAIIGPDQGESDEETEDDQYENEEYED